MWAFCFVMFSFYVWFAVCLCMGIVSLRCVFWFVFCMCVVITSTPVTKYEYALDISSRVFFVRLGS